MFIINEKNYTLYNLRQKDEWSASLFYLPNFILPAITEYFFLFMVYQLIFIFFIIMRLFFYSLVYVNVYKKTFCCKRYVL